jgi:pantothenate kinase
VLESFNDSLPLYDREALVDYEDENFIPTIEKNGDNGAIIRGRGGDSTSIKITESGVNPDHSFAQVIPMDGFHLPRSILEKFKDSETAFKRRGSPFTFDSSLVVKLVENINETLKIPNDPKLGNLDIFDRNNSIPNVFIPGFNHAEHDPNQYGQKINSSSRILIMEGLYLLLNNPVWLQIPNTLNPDVEMSKEATALSEITQNLVVNDNISKIPISPIGKNYEFWKILIDRTKMLQRLGKRHLNAAIVKTLKDGEERVKLNDLPNGAKIYAESFESDLNIISIDDCNEAS